MNVAIFSEYYAPHRGGVEVRAAGIATALVELGHDVVVHTVGYEAALPAFQIIDGVRVVRFPAYRYGASRLGATRRDPVSMLRFALWCRRRARAPFDLLIYEEFPFVHALFAPRAARGRALLDWCEYRRHPVFTLAQRFLPRMFRWNAAVSPDVAARIAAASGRPVLTLPSGIHLANFRALPRAERSGIVYVGRLWPHKNFALTIQSFEALCDRGYAGTLTIAGTGPEEQAIRRAAAASRWSHRIVLAGAVSEAAKIHLLAGAELFLLLSSREGFPVAVAEAMASALPTVTVRLPDNGAASVVTQSGAGLVATADAHAVADAVEGVLRDWDGYSRRCLEAARELEWRVVVGALLTRDLQPSSRTAGR